MGTGGGNEIPVEDVRSRLGGGGGGPADIAGNWGGGRFGQVKEGEAGGLVSGQVTLPSPSCSSDRLLDRVGS